MPFRDHHEVPNIELGDSQHRIAVLKQSGWSVLRSSSTLEVRGYQCRQPRLTHPMESQVILFPT